MEKQIETKAVPVKVAVDTQTFICKSCGGVIKYDANMLTSSVYSMHR